MLNWHRDCGAVLSGQFSGFLKQFCENLIFALCSDFRT